MRLCVFADIHGNIYAFRNVLRKMQEEECDLNLFLGDICGYYYHQDEVIGLLKNMKHLFAVKGNHDELFLKIMDDNNLEAEYTERYGFSARLLKAAIKPESLSFLHGLTDVFEVENKMFAFYHGSPWNHLEEYVYPDSSLERFAGLGYSFVFCAHTHYPMDRTIGTVRVVNPGSCGQPRNKMPPSFAIVDTDKGNVKFHYVPYDPTPLLRDIQRHDERLEYLSEVLLR